MSKVKRIVLGLTGGVGTGKSTVMGMLSKAGVPSLSTDEVSHDAILRGQPAYRQIVRHFGRAILGPKLEIDRSALGRLVFSDPQARRWLEGVIHPRVHRAVRAFVRMHSGLVLVDIPLLFESRWQALVDKIIVVTAPRAVQVARLKKRNGWSTRQIGLRLAAQWPLGKKKMLADIVLDNGKDIAHLRRSVAKMLEQLKSS